MQQGALRYYSQSRSTKCVHFPSGNQLGRSWCLPFPSHSPSHSGYQGTYTSLRRVQSCPAALVWVLSMLANFEGHGMGGANRQIHFNWTPNLVKRNTARANLAAETICRARQGLEKRPFGMMPEVGAGVWVYAVFKSGRLQGDPRQEGRHRLSDCSDRAQPKLSHRSHTPYTSLQLRFC
jgi:hypothetical protein